MWRLVRYITLAVLLALALQPAYAAEAPQPGLTLPPTGTQGTRFVFVGEGFAANEQLSSWANTPDGRVIAYDSGVLARVASNGSVSWNWVAPEAFQPGAWQFVVHGLSSGVERVFSFGISAVSAIEPGAQYNIQPSAGRPGDIFHFYAIGFTEGEDVSARIVGPDGQAFDKGLSADGVARVGGRVDGTWVVPVSVSQYGAWRIELSGRTSRVERAIPLRIDPAPTPGRPAPRVSPTVGRQGLLFIFSAVGFQPDEQLSAWVNAPDGRIIAVDEDEIRPAASDGSVTWDWTAPADAPPGAWSMVVHGRKSGIEQVVPFQILPA